MVLSTAELKPTAYVSGIQSATTYVALPKDMLVQRQWTMADTMRRKIPAAINPTDASRLHICVGPGQQASLTGDYSAPLLQTIDLQSFTSVSTQALTRTNPTDTNVNAEGKPPSEPRITHISYSNDGKWLASVDEWQPLDNDVDNVSGDQKEQFTRDRLEVFLKFWEAKDDGSLALVSRINSPHSSSSPEKVLDLASSPAANCFATLGADAKLRLWRTRTHKGRDTAAREQVDMISWANSLVVPLSDMVSEDVMIENEDNPAPVSAARKGCIEFSEDGSTLFAAYGTEENGAVNIIDVASGDVIDSIEGLWKGDLRAIGVVSPYLIVLSDELRVFDIVSDELRYAIQVPSDLGTKELLSLAVDRETGHFAVSLPIGQASSIGIFDPENPEPLLVRSTPQQIISLISSPNSSGFVAIDDAAQVWTIAEGSDPSSISAVQPLEDLRLEEGAVAQVNGFSDDSKDLVMTLGGDDAEGSDDEFEGDGGDVVMGDDDDDDDNRPRVIPQQALTEIFDAAPNYQAANVEDLFYKVVALTQQTR
jgi:NET1-associated nuclear protein 1 (U3 small nucleolar RNA-associated protein 17)